MEWDGDLMRVDIEHSLMETAALVSSRVGVEACPLCD